MIANHENRREMRRKYRRSYVVRVLSFLCFTDLCVLDSFKRSYPYPSFNVKDLHTVDNGVIAHLIPELRTNGWDIIIAHFLGVDHCGHRYGPYHREMADKLLQRNTCPR